MVKIILIALTICIIWIILKSNLRIKWHTFFKKGFKKLDNLFGIVCYCAKQRKTAKHIVLLNFVKNRAKNMVMKLLQTF